MSAMVQIAIDGNEANTSQRVGSNVYAFELLTALEKLTADQPEVQWTVLLSHTAVTDLPKARAGWTYTIVTPRRFWTQWALPIHLFLYQKKYNVFFTPGHYAPRLSAVPYISSVMDLAFIHFPQQFRKKDTAQLTEWTRYSIKHAKKVLAISHFTQQEVIKYYHRQPADVFVAYPALPTGSIIHNQEKVPANWIKKILNTSAPFFLYVGTLQPRKNLVTLVKAYEKFCQKFPQQKFETPHLLIAGKVGWLAEETLRTVNRSPVKEKIHLLGYVSEAEKYQLYRKSLCTILIGLYEGFGLPPLEAMAAGTLPVVANTSSLAEVVGEAGFSVSPKNTTEIAEVLEKITHLKAKQRGALLKKGRQQVKAFSWQTTAEIILTQLLEVATAYAK